MAGDGSLPRAEGNWTDPEGSRSRKTMEMALQHPLPVGSLRGDLGILTAWYLERQTRPADLAWPAPLRGGWSVGWERRASEIQDRWDPKCLGARRLRPRPLVALAAWKMDLRPPVLTWVARPAVAGTSRAFRPPQPPDKWLGARGAVGEVRLFHPLSALAPLSFPITAAIGRAGRALGAWGDRGGGQNGLSFPQWG